MALDLFSSEALNDPAECIIRVGEGDQEITDYYAAVEEVSVEVRRTAATQASVRFGCYRDSDGKFSVMDDEVLVPWAPIKIEAAFGEYTEEVMRGYIRELRSDYPESQSATFTVMCQDASLALDRLHRRQVWGAETPSTDAEILQSILSETNLTLNPDSGAGQTGIQVSQDSTDVVFLRQRAAANGYELIFSQGQVYFGPWRLESTAQATINVYAGRDTHCSTLSVTFDGHHPDKVGFDTAETSGSGVTNQILEPDFASLGNTPVDSNDAGLADFVWMLSRNEGVGEAELQATAQRKVNEASMKIKAEGELDGSAYGHVLRVGEPVGLDGVGEMHNGIYYVDAVTHTFTSTGYRQKFVLLRNAYGDNLDSGSSLLSGIL